MLRMLVCSLVGLGLISNGITSMQNTNLVEMAYVPFVGAFEVAIGTFIIMFAFSPSLGKTIIKSVTHMFNRRRY